MDVVSNMKGQMSGILTRRADTGEESVLEAKGLFYGIGHSPNSQLLQGQVKLDSSGYVLVEEGTAKTSVEGVFAAGDVQVIFLYFILAWDQSENIASPKYLEICLSALPEFMAWSD